MLEKLKAFKYPNNSYNYMYVITCQITNSMIVEYRVYCLNDKKCNFTNNWKENFCI